MAESLDLAAVIALLQALFFDDHFRHVTGAKHFAKDLFPNLLRDDSLVDHPDQRSDVCRSQWTLTDRKRTLTMLGRFSKFAEQVVGNVVGNRFRRGMLQQGRLKELAQFALGAEYGS